MASFTGLGVINSVLMPKDKLHFPLSFYGSSSDFYLPSIFATVRPAGHPPLAVPEDSFPVSSLSLGVPWTLSSHHDKFTWHLLGETEEPLLLSAGVLWSVL